MKSLNLLLFLIGISHTIIAQNSISGRIADEQNAGVPFANVLLLNTADSVLVKGVVTDQEGDYLIANVSRGNYLIQSYMVGYAKSYSSEISINDGNTTPISDIILKEDTQELDEVVIKAEKPLYEQTIDRMVINVQSSPVMAGKSVLEILETSPGVNIDWQNSSIGMNGKNGVSVMINGKMTRMDMAALFAMLDGMPANNIEKIELITTPPANFDAEGNAGFINIVLKKNDKEGLNGSISAGIEHRRKGWYNASGNINYRKKKVNVFADYSYSYRKPQAIFGINNEIQNEQYLFSSNSSAHRNAEVGLSNGRMGIDYDLSSNTTIGVLGTFTIRNWEQISDNSAYYTINPGVDTLFTGVRNETNLLKQYMANINFQHKFNKQQKLNMDLDYIGYSSDQYQTYGNEYFTENGQSLNTEDIRIDKLTPLNMMVGKIDYTYSASDQFSFEAGVKATISQFENDVKTETLEANGWEVDATYTDYNIMDEDILAAYSSISTKLGEKTSLKAGLRYEQTITNIRGVSDKQILYRDYGYFFPSAFLMRKLTKNSSLNLAYSYRITRPRFTSLAPSVNFIEPKVFVTGNSKIQPSLTHSIKSGYTYKKADLSVEYNSIAGEIAGGSPARISGTNSTIVSPLNLDNTELFSLNLSFPIYVTKWWEIYTSLIGISKQVRSKYLNETIEISNKWYAINSTQSFKLPQNITMELKIIYRSGALFGVRKLEPYRWADFAIRKKLGTNGGALNLSFSDIFYTRILEFSSNIPEFNLTHSRSYDFDTRGIKLIYTNSFGNKKLKSRRKRKTGSAEDIRRL